MSVVLNDQRRPICNACGFPLRTGQPAILHTNLDDPDDDAAWIYHQECDPGETP